jgi:hypothetical protein
MFLGKLWVRIKGGFLVARENLSEGLDSQEAGKKLMNKVQTILKGETPGRPEEMPESSSGPREIRDLVDENYHRKSIKEIENALEELKKPQDKPEDGEPDPNPRKLG